MLFPNFQIDPTPSAIVAHSQHYHICLLCGSKNILCVATEQCSHAPDYTICTIFKQNLIHRLCVPHLLDIKLKPLVQTSPLTFQQQIVIASIKSKLISLNTQTSSFTFKKQTISPLTFKQKLILALIKIQQMKSTEKIQLLKFFLLKKNKKLNSQQKQKPKVNQRDTTNDLDWFKEYPVTESMKNNTKLNNSTAQQLFNFIKPYLIDIYSEKIIQAASENASESKCNYKYLTKTLVSKKPKFLTNLIYEANSSVDRSI
jgi:hypothetical protein